jgi:Icc-related predicted phosphoesterase
MLDELDLIPKWALIPDDTDVLIVHGPPHGATDLTALFGSVNAGSKTLRERIEALDIPLVITGHIHEGYGSDRIGNSAIENVSLVDVHYNPINPARTFTVPGLRAAGGAA